MLVAGEGRGLTALLVFTGTRSSISRASWVMGSFPVSCTAAAAAVRASGEQRHAVLGVSSLGIAVMRGVAKPWCRVGGT